MFQCPLGKFTYTLSSSELNGELVLNNVSSVDHGNYTCRVVHDPRSDDDVGYHGSASTSLDVIYGPDSGMRIGSRENTDQVYYWPDRNVKEEDYFHEESLYQENEAGFISCLAHCRPRCGYTWTFNGSELETWGFVSDNYVFKRKVTRYDSGEYSCTATNPTSLKSRSVNFNIVVSYGPSNSTRISKSSSAHARDTQQHIFTCSAQCVPSCSYTWKFGHAVLVSSSSDGQLSVSENSGHKTGHYTCVAVNEKTGETGAVSAFVDLDAEGEQSSGVYAGVATGVALLVVLVLVVIMLVIKNRRAEKYRAVNTNMILDTCNKTDPSKEDNQL